MKEISDKLNDQIDSVLARYLPNGRRQGNEWCCGSLQGDPGQSLRVHLGGDKRGVWKDFATGEVGGDLIDLIQAKLGCDKGAAVKEAKEFLGLDDDSLVNGTPYRRKVEEPDPWTPIIPIPKGVIIPSRHPSLGEAVARYVYSDATGAATMAVLRFDIIGKDGKPELNSKGKATKAFQPVAYYRHQDGREAFRWRMPYPQGQRPLYGLFTLGGLPGVTVNLFEGEKAVDAARRLFLGKACTTWPGGVQNVIHTNFSPLAGRHVLVWPDNDAEGRQAALTAAERILAAGAVEVRIVQIPQSWPDGWDVANTIPEGQPVDILDRLRAGAIDAAQIIAQAPLSMGPAVAQAAPAPSAGSNEAEIARLSTLKPFEYEKERIEAAAKMGVRAGVLDKLVAAERKRDDGDQPAMLFSDIDLWPHPVAGNKLLSEISAVFSRHMVLPSGAADAAALWVLHAHTHDSARISPLLALTSPTPECGKTTMLSLLGSMVPKALPASNITAAALFRAVEKWKPTLLVDEADTFLRDSDELRGVINSGHNRRTAFVIRTVGDDHDPAQFTTWAPKAIALIGKLPATLASRAIHVELRRMAPAERKEPVREDRLGRIEPLGRMAARWAADTVDALRNVEPDMPKALTGRRADNWRHLFAIADIAGGDWPARARTAAESLSVLGAGDTAAITLLTDIKTIFDAKETDRITSSDLAAELAGMEHRPWVEWVKGKPITARQVAKLLEPFKVSPGTIRTGLETAKGYRSEQFTDVFSWYLSFDPSHRHNPQETAENQPFRFVTSEINVTDRNDEKPKEFTACDGVTDKKPQSWDLEA